MHSSLSCRSERRNTGVSRVNWESRVGGGRSREGESRDSAPSLFTWERSVGGCANELVGCSGHNYVSLDFIDGIFSKTFQVFIETRFHFSLCNLFLRCRFRDTLPLPKSPSFSQELTPPVYLSLVSSKVVPQCKVVPVFPT